MPFALKIQNFGNNIPMIFKEIIRPWFFIGVSIKVLLAFLTLDNLSAELYIPFLKSSYNFIEIGFNPWIHWIQADGNPLAFPYGYIMWFALTPLVYLSDIFFHTPSLGYIGTLIIFDIAVLIVLRKIFKKNQYHISVLYWFSPIIILPTYLLGMNDIVPLFFLTLSMYYLKKRDLVKSGFVIGIAVSAKLSMIIGIPFFIIYCLNNSTVQKNYLKLFFGLIASGVIFNLSFFLSNGTKEMVLNIPEMQSVYSLTLRLNEDINLYLMPLIYILALYYFWRIRRPNFNLFFITTGVAFAAVVFTTSFEAGWFIWLVPCLVFFQATAGGLAIISVHILSLIYVLNLILNQTIKLKYFTSENLLNTLSFGYETSNIDLSIFQTLLTATGIIIITKMIRDTVTKNDYFRLSKKPFAIGIAGDSGSGKDTLVKSIINLVGKSSAVSISVDDYHNWDRQKPIWKFMTHLNPLMNNLEKLDKDILLLLDSKSITKTEYNHQSGQKELPVRVKSKSFILVSGLHSFYLPRTRESFDLKIFLDIDEDLRRFFKLKRDVLERGHNKENVLKYIGDRVEDSKKFIQPQLEYADLTLTLKHQKSDINILDNLEKDPKLLLLIRARNHPNQVALQRVLVGLCNLNFDLKTPDATGEIIITIEGDVDAVDVKRSAIFLCEDMFEFLDPETEWHSGMLGIMQLVTLLHIQQKLIGRLT